MSAVFIASRASPINPDLQPFSALWNITLTDVGMYEFTDDMFEHYQAYSSEHEGMHHFSGYDAFSKTLKTIPYIEWQRMCKNNHSNPQSCYGGLVYKQPSPLLDEM